jgi:hypothetical protein
MYDRVWGSDGEPPEPLRTFTTTSATTLGTPMELTDEDGNIAWEANYKAWGEARLTISEAATKAGLKNPIGSRAVSGRRDGAALQPVQVLRPGGGEVCIERSQPKMSKPVWCSIAFFAR